MFKRDEAAKIKQEFWTAFGQYMKPVLSAEMLRVNWLNYNTGLKDVYFRMDVKRNGASIAISIEHRDPGIQELFFEQFQLLHQYLNTHLDEEWDWQLHVTNEQGKVVSQICKELPGKSIFDKNHWSDLISFFKPRIIALDAFWENAKYSFDELR